MARRITWKRLNEALAIDPVAGTCHWREPNKNCHSVEIGVAAGSMNGRGRHHISVDGRRYYRSVLVWFFVKKRWPRRMVDHRDGDKLNDIFDNLREATASQNQQNNRRRKGVSGVKGVSPKGEKFVARITLNQKTKNLGCFRSKEEAAAAYATAATEMFGDFACV